MSDNTEAKEETKSEVNLELQELATSQEKKLPKNYQYMIVNHHLEQEAKSKSIQELDELSKKAKTRAERLKIKIMKKKLLEQKL